MMKNQKGITLIALVITIIVLLILAGVSIAMLTGENGLLTKAGNAKTQTNEAEAKEAVTIAVGTILANKNDPTYLDSLKENETALNTIDADTIVSVVITDTGLTANDVKSTTPPTDVTGAKGAIKYKDYVVSFDANGRVLDVSDYVASQGS